MSHTLAALDVKSLRQEPPVTLYEDYSQPHQQRAFRYINSLKKRDLKNLFHKTDKDAEAVKASWDRFADGRHKQGGKFQRVYSPPASGAPGRLACASALHTIPRVFRNALLKDTCSLLKLKGCGVSSLCWLCHRYHIGHDLMRMYADRQEIWHHEAQLESGMCARACEDFVDRAIRLRQAPKTKHKAFQDLAEQIHTAKVKLYGIPELQWVHQYTKADNALGSFVAILLDSIAAAIVRACMRFAEHEYEWVIPSMGHDGFTPVGRFTNDTHAAALAAFSSLAEQLCPGLGLKFAWEPLDMDVYNRAGEWLRAFEVDAAWVEPDERDDEGLFMGDAEYEPCYEVVKSSFEAGVFKVSDNYVDLVTDRDGRMAIIARKVLLDRFEEMAYSEEGKSGRVNKSFLPRWIKDHRIQKFNRFVMDPTMSHDKDTEYNMWQGYDVERVAAHDPVEGKKLVLEWLGFLKHLFADRRHTMMALDWHAHFFKYPELKAGMAACLVGDPGGGKSTYFNVIMRMIGKDLTMVTDHPENDVCGSNGTMCIANKKFINLLECSRDQLFAIDNHLKAVVTDAELRYKTMGKDPIMGDSRHNVGLSTNNFDSVPEKDGERRYWVPLCTTYWACWRTPAEKEAFFGHLYSDVIENPAFQAHYREFLMRREIPKRFLPDHVPVGELQKTLRVNNANWVEKFLLWLFDRPEFLDADGVISLSCGELDRRLRNCQEDQNWKFTKNERSLTTKLSYMRLTWKCIRGGNEEHRVWDPRVKENVNMWHFDLDELRPRLRINVSKDRERRDLGKELDRTLGERKKLLHNSEVFAWCRERGRQDVVTAFLDRDMESWSVWDRDMEGSSSIRDYRDSDNLPGKDADLEAVMRGNKKYAQQLNKIDAEIAVIADKIAKLTPRAETEDEFDPEAEYERLMGDYQVAEEAAPPPAKRPKTTIAMHKPVTIGSAPFVLEGRDDAPSEDYEDPQQARARELMRTREKKAPKEASNLPETFLEHLAAKQKE